MCLGKLKVVLIGLQKTRSLRIDISTPDTCSTFGASVTESVIGERNLRLHLLSITQPHMKRWALFSGKL